MGWRYDAAVEVVRDDSAVTLERVAGPGQLAGCCIAIGIVATAIFAMLHAGGEAIEGLAIGIAGVIGQWTFSGSDTLKRVHDAPAISIARPTQDPVRGTRRLALLAAVGFAIVVIGRELAPGMLLDALVAVLVLAVYHLAEWVAVRRIEERRGAIAYRRSPAGDGPPLVVCRPDPALEAFGR